MAGREPPDAAELAPVPADWPAPTIWDELPPTGPYPVPVYPYPGWRPYCSPCPRMVRMKRTAFGWECPDCRNPIGPDLMRRVGPYARELRAHECD